MCFFFLLTGEEKHSIEVRLGGDLGRPACDHGK